MHFWQLYIIGFLALSLLGSCKQSYQQVLKSNDLEYKYEMAKKYYNKKDYYKALPIFEELMNIYKGTKSVEKIYYYYAYCFYGQGEYLMAAYHFKNLANTYPNGEYAEECNYMYAYTQYVLSPLPSLDQTYTLKAVEAFQLFINLYPSSEKVSLCNDYIDKMRATLIQKDFNSAKLYYDLGYYRAANISFDNLLKTYPDLENKEAAYFYKLRSNYYFALNSIEEKQEERLLKTLAAYKEFSKRFPESKLQKEAKNILDSSDKLLNKIKSNDRS